MDEKKLLSVDELLNKRADTASGLPEDDVEVPSLGGIVRVRGLSRDEVFGTQQIKGTEAQERKIISLGLIEPTMTVAQVGQWQLVSPAGEMEPVADMIRELSGLKEGADKSSVSDDGDES